MYFSGLVHSPVISSGRTISLCLLIFTFLLYQFYSASIVSSLLSEPPRTIKTLADLLKSQLKVLIEDIAYNYDFFEVGLVTLWLFGKEVVKYDRCRDCNQASYNFFLRVLSILSKMP